jgi:hypothetical protein
MKGILIDAVNRQVREVEWETHEDVYKHIGASCFDVAYVGEWDSIFVDDEGLLNLQGDSPMFTFGGYNGALAGNGLLTSFNEEGISIEPNMTLEVARERVRFHTALEIHAMLQLRKLAAMLVAEKE